MARKDPRRNELLDAMFRLRGATFERCFWPDLSCERVAIRAHSVQNATALDLLVEDGHVIAPVQRLDVKRGPQVRLQRVGRNKATTFSGLCAEHDRQIFAPIETNALNLSDVHHRFLLAYRATFYEVHATGAAAVLLQTGYQTRADLGFDSRDVPSPAGMLAVEKMIVFHQTWVYKTEFDKAYLDGDFTGIEHDLLEFEVRRPTVAASALFSLDEVQREDDIVRVCLTILPVTPTRTIALFSYIQADAGLARLALDRVLHGVGDYQKFELSRRLISHCENFVLAPSFVADWNDDRKRAVVAAFQGTIGTNALAPEDPRLNLFD